MRFLLQLLIGHFYILLSFLDMYHLIFVILYIFLLIRHILDLVMISKNSDSLYILFYFPFYFIIIYIIFP